MIDDLELELLNNKIRFFYNFFSKIRVNVNSDIKALCDFGFQIEAEHLDMRIKYSTFTDRYDGIYPFGDIDCYHENRKTDIMLLTRLLIKFNELYNDMINDELRQHYLSTKLFFMEKYKWDDQIIDQIFYNRGETEQSS